MTVTVTITDDLSPGTPLQDHYLARGSMLGSIFVTVTVAVTRISSSLMLRIRLALGGPGVSRLGAQNN